MGLVSSKPYPPITSEEIAGGLQRFGLLEGAGVMVHSSLRSFGQVEGGAEAVIRALMQVVTPAGTIMMPSFNHGVIFEQDPAAVFDPLTTPTINGAIPDRFWRMPGVYRSLDPTHAIAAWGKNAERYTRYHHRTLTMGPDSPLGMLCAEGGYGLFLGVHYGANTFHHVVEMSTGAPCLGQRTEAHPVRLPDGRVVEGRTWRWRARACPITDYHRYAPFMRPHQRRLRIGRCTATLFRLSDCYAVIEPLLRQGLGPYPPCSACPIRPHENSPWAASDWDADAGRLLPDSAAWSY